MILIDFLKIYHCCFRNRRIRFKSYTRPKSEPAKPPQKDEFDDEFLDLGDSDYSSSDSTSSDGELIGI